MINKYMKICEDNISHIVKRPSMYGDGLLLESYFLGCIAFTCLIRHLPILKVLELWKDYRYRLFNSDQYLLSELPPDCIIETNVDYTSINRVFDEVFAGLSMYYTKTKIIELSRNNSCNNTLQQSQIELLNFVEAEMMLAIQGEYNIQFSRIPLFYETFCKAILTQYANCVIGSEIPSLYEYQYLFVPHKYYDIATFAFNDPRNLKYINERYNDSLDLKTVSGLYQNNNKKCISNGKRNKFYWNTHELNNDTTLRIREQIISGLTFVAKCIVPELQISSEANDDNEDKHR